MFYLFFTFWFFLLLRGFQHLLDFPHLYPGQLQLLKCCHRDSTSLKMTSLVLYYITNYFVESLVAFNMHLCIKTHCICKPIESIYVLHNLNTYLTWSLMVMKEIQSGGKQFHHLVLQMFLLFPLVQYLSHSL